jgi:Flp pilus assembly protein TadB
VDVLTPREKLIVVLPLIAGVVIVLVYFGLFANPLVIVVIFVLWVAVSLRNKRKFNRESAGR